MTKYFCLACKILVEKVAARDAEIADLKQQLHAYKEYHDAREDYERLCRANAYYSETYAADERRRKANDALQILRNSKG